ncbi:AAA family ATPase [Georgenia yuyongxinii]
MASDDLSVQQLANRALDRCATAASTWTVHTVQEHVTRLITEAGVRATPQALVNLITITTRLALADCLSVLPPGAAAPEHVPHLTNLHVIAADTHLRDLLTARPAGAPLSDLPQVAGERGLDPEQVRAAAAIASDAPLVVVEGVAGAGKTTMLGAAIRAAAENGRATPIVTPTKKAAAVAAHELSVPADSVAKLVHAHGWRWNTDGVWTRLTVGATDPETGATYTGPPPGARLQHGERIVVDEAGMLDQDTALALLILADEADGTLALVGDRAQLPAVGRGGVLDLAADLVGSTYDMGTVHRFTDPDYAHLTLQMRAGHHPAALFDRLHTLGLVRVHESTEALHEAIAHTARDGEAITTATNDEARELNERIRGARVRQGLVDDVRTTSGSDGLLIGAGDVIQTRHNDNALRVANRQTWTVQRIGDDGAAWVSEHNRGRRHTVRLPAEYLAEHAHLAYATTAYGVQGTTVAESHTILSDALDAAGVYVGMTRGRTRNLLHVVATDLADARAQFTVALERDRADRGLTDATRAARAAVSGLAPLGLAVVNAERARLRELVATADREAARLERAMDALARQTAAHHTEHARQAQIVAAADTHLEAVRADVAAPLIEQAAADGAGYLTAQERMWQANRALAGSGRFGRRTSARLAQEATQAHAAVRHAVSQRWGDTPLTTTHLPAWINAAAWRRVDADPRVIEAKKAADRVHLSEQQLVMSHAAAFAALWQDVGCGRMPGSLEARATELRRHAHQARRGLVTIDALPVAEAELLIRQNATRAMAERLAEEPRKARTAQAGRRHSQSPAHRPDTGRGFGPSL